MTPTNEEFLSQIFPTLQEYEYVAVCSKVGDPSLGGWSPQTHASKLPTTNNNFFVPSLFVKNRRLKVKKEFAVTCSALVLDDVGSRVQSDRFVIPPSWNIETSSSNFQCGYIFESPINAKQADSLWQRFRDADLTDPGASGPMTRWARLPQGVNGKPK